MFSLFLHFSFLCLQILHKSPLICDLYPSFTTFTFQFLATEKCAFYCRKDERKAWKAQKKVKKMEKCSF